MEDFVVVNIYNEEYIPWLRRKGPIFGEVLGYGIYEILSRDRNLIMELTTRNAALQKKKEYIERKFKKIREMEQQKNIIKNEENTNDSLKIQDKIEIAVIEKKEEEKVQEQPKFLESPVVEKTDEDNEIDAILDTAPEKESAIKVDLTEENKGTKEFKTYTNKQLKEMTKKDLKEILLDRGYSKGPYSPKYHDNIDTLILKVKRTQM